MRWLSRKSYPSYCLVLISLFNPCECECPSGYLSRVALRIPVSRKPVKKLKSRFFLKKKQGNTSNSDILIFFKPGLFDK